jgi:hypothetical protein
LKLFVAIYIISKKELDKETITMIETSSDWYISRTPTIENFKKFKESVTDFLEKYPIK